MQLGEAKWVAEKLVDVLWLHCERVEIAGSIRRQCAEVKDIEIVTIPRMVYGDSVPDLFGECEEINSLHDWAQHTSDVQWIKPGTSEIVPWPPKPEAKYLRGLLPCGIKLDLFITTPESWGVIFMIRTGSAEFSHEVASRAQRRGMRFDGGSLIHSDGVWETPEELDVFNALRLQYVEPVDRVGRESVREA